MPIIDVGNNYSTRYSATTHIINAQYFLDGTIGHLGTFTTRLNLHRIAQIFRAVIDHRGMSTAVLIHHVVVCWSCPPPPYSPYVYFSEILVVLRVVSKGEPPA